MVKALLEYCGSSDLSKTEALESATNVRQLEIVKLLLNAGADPERKVKDNRNAVYIAITNFQYWYQEDSHPNIDKVRDVLLELLKHIQAGPNARTNIVECMRAIHAPYCMQKWDDPRFCYFCEFVPELKKKFGG